MPRYQDTLELCSKTIKREHVLPLQTGVGTDTVRLEVLWRYSRT